MKSRKWLAAGCMMVSGGHGADCVGGGPDEHITGVIHVNSEQTSHPIVVNGDLQRGEKVVIAIPSSMGMWAFRGSGLSRP